MSGEELQEVLEGCWRVEGFFKNHRLGMGLQKTEIMSDEYQGAAMNTRLDVKEIKKSDGLRNDQWYRGSAR